MSDELFPGTTDQLNKLVESVSPKLSGLDALGPLKEMKKKLDLMDEKRNLIWDYIESNLVKGTDYGPADERNPKPVLLKPGAEKCCKMFNTTAKWDADFDTWKMLGEPKDVVCYKCLIVDNATGNIVGEGRGSERVGNRQRDVNKSIKAAEKRALVDAALYTFMLSERFTQDEGAGGKTQMAELKEHLLSDIGVRRAGIVSELTDIQWLVKVLHKEIHKKRIDTSGELVHMRKVLFELENYDFGSGEKVK